MPRIGKCINNFNLYVVVLYFCERCTVLVTCKHFLNMFSQRCPCLMSPLEGRFPIQCNILANCTIFNFSSLVLTFYINFMSFIPSRVYSIFTTVSIFIFRFLVCYLWCYILFYFPSQLKVWICYLYYKQRPNLGLEMWQVRLSYRIFPSRRVKKFCISSAYSTPLTRQRSQSKTHIHSHLVQIQYSNQHGYANIYFFTLIFIYQVSLLS